MKAVIDFYDSSSRINFRYEAYFQSDFGLNMENAWCDLEHIVESLT